MKSKTSLLLIALSLAITTVCLGTTNTLFSSDSVSSSFTMAFGEDYEISINAPVYADEVIIPGQEIAFPVTVVGESQIPSYLFAEVFYPSDFTVYTGTSEGISSAWTPLTKDINDNVLENMYYLGTADGLTTFSDTAALFDKFVVGDVTPDALTLNYDVVVTVWAIQKAGFEAYTPAQAWEEAKSCAAGE